MALTANVEQVIAVGRSQLGYSESPRGSLVWFRPPIEGRMAVCAQSPCRIGTSPCSQGLEILDRAD